MARGLPRVLWASSGFVLKLRWTPDLGCFELGHSQQPHQRRKIRRDGKIDSVADFEVDFAKDLSLGRWRTHAREKCSIPSGPVPFPFGHDCSALLQRFNHWPPDSVESDLPSGRVPREPRRWLRGEKCRFRLKSPVVPG